MNQMELTPNYAGTLRGFTNTFGNIQGFVAPLIAGAISNNDVSFLFGYLLIPGGPLHSQSFYLQS